MVFKRILHIIIVLGVLGLLFYLVSTAFTRPPLPKKIYKDPNFSPVYGVPDNKTLNREISVAAGKDVAVAATVTGRAVSVTGRTLRNDPDQLYANETMYKKVIYMPVSIFRKFPDVDRVRCVITNGDRAYGVDVDRKGFEDFVGISANNPSNNWEANVVYMLVYDKINRDNFMELYGLYKPEF